MADKKVVNEILRQGRKLPADKRKRYVRAAIATGIVESGLENLNHGDADSEGWRQERPQFYPNPTNIRASVRRFFEEAAQHDRGQSAGQLAAEVQRPREDLRGRYAEVIARQEPKQYLKGLKGGAADVSSRD